MSVNGSMAEGSGEFLVFVDCMPSARIEDASKEVWAEARQFYGPQKFELVGTFETSEARGYKFSALSAVNSQ